jgi:hypothetical protein
VYRNEIAHSVPADTRAQAVTAADQLPSSVLQAATEAFRHGLQIAAGTTPAGHCRGRDPGDGPRAWAIGPRGEGRRRCAQVPS